MIQEPPTFIHEAIEQSIRSRSVSRIVYFGGSSPGVPRDILPVALDGEYLRARTPGAKPLKTFKVSKILSVTLSDGHVVERNQPKTLVEAHVSCRKSLEDYVNALTPEYESRGWSVRFDQETRCFSVSRYFKNGKSRKTPAASISFWKEEKQPEVDLDTGEILNIAAVQSNRQRPWSVRGEHWNHLGSYKLLHTAMGRFMKVVDGLTP